MDYSQIVEIPFEQAVEGPLLACNEAQMQVLRSTYEYLEDSMWERQGGTREYKPAYMEFFFMQDGGAQRLRVPLMALVPSPVLQLDDLTINYQTRVSQASSEKLTVRMLGENTESTESAELHSYLTIRLHAGVSDMPMGLSKMYQLFSDHLISVSGEEEK